MRISNGNIDSVGSGSVGSVGGGGSESRSSSAASAKSDSVSLSSAANLVALAKASASSRQSKVDDLSAQIKSGAYETDNAQVSRAVVSSHISA